MDVVPPPAAAAPAITQCDIIVIDISASMRAHSSLDPDEGHAGTADGSVSGSDYDPSARETTTSTRRTREDISKILFHTMIDKTLVFELSHSVGLLAFGKEVLPMAITNEYERFHDELGRLDAGQCGTNRAHPCLPPPTPASPDENTSEMPRAPAFMNSTLTRFAYAASTPSSASP